VKPLVVTVPGNRNDDVPIGTLRSILGKAEIEATMKRYAVVFEKAESNWAAYVPDLPGWEALEPHLEAMREVGEPIPEPTADVDFVELQIVA
jgi:predicted RNase H-like HicB family nuclease